MNSNNIIEAKANGFNIKNIRLNGYDLYRKILGLNILENPTKIQNVASSSVFKFCIVKDFIIYCSSQYLYLYKINDDNIELKQTLSIIDIINSTSAINVVFSSENNNMFILYNTNSSDPYACIFYVDEDNCTINHIQNNQMYYGINYSPIFSKDGTLVMIPFKNGSYYNFAIYKFENNTVTFLHQEIAKYNILVDSFLRNREQHYVFSENNKYLFVSSTTGSYWYLYEIDKENNTVIKKDITNQETSLCSVRFINEDYLIIISNSSTSIYIYNLNTLESVKTTVSSTGEVYEVSKVYNNEFVLITTNKLSRFRINDDLSITTIFSTNIYNSYYKVTYISDDLKIVGGVTINSSDSYNIYKYDNETNSYIVDEEFGVKFLFYKDKNMIIGGTESNKASIFNAKKEEISTETDYTNFIKISNNLLITYANNSSSGDYALSSRGYAFRVVRVIE